ncbi:hypothetical protein NFI96_014497 [Prochilodus magdalenae]|nr:hypothetical protein NFI96_014497 [Prochilodus magdalenae]
MPIWASNSSPLQAINPKYAFAIFVPNSLFFSGLCESAAAAPSPVMGNMPPNDGMPGGPMPPGFFQGPPGSQPSPHAQPPPHNPNNPMMGPHGQPFMSPRYPGGPRPSLRMPNQPPVGVPGSQPLLPNSLDPRPQGHPNMGGPMRMNPPRGMGGMGPQNYGGGMRPPPNSLGGPAMSGMNMGPGGRGPWPNPNANSIAYSSSSPGNYVGPPGGGGPPGTPIMPSPGDSTNSSENIYTMMNPIGPGGNRPNFPMGPGPDGPMGGMGSMEPHHMNGSLGSGDMDGLPKNSPNNMAGMNNPPGTPRDDGEMGGNFLNPFQSESYGWDCSRKTHSKLLLLSAKAGGLLSVTFYSLSSATSFSQRPTTEARVGPLFDCRLHSEMEKLNW